MQYSILLLLRLTCVQIIKRAAVASVDVLPEDVVMDGPALACWVVTSVLGPAGRASVRWCLKCGEALRRLGR